MAAEHDRELPRHLMSTFDLSNHGSAPSTTARRASHGRNAGGERWPLTGREFELAHIAAARSDPTCGGVVVSGPAGVGKSRLAREALAAAEGEGAVCLWVQATESTAAIPFGAFANLIPDGAAVEDRLQLMRSITSSVRHRAGVRPICLGVDDAHLLDAPSAGLLWHLASTDELFVLATVRSDRPGPDAIESLWKDGSARRLELGSLRDDEIARLVETGLGNPVQQRTLRRVTEIAAGNPLYARELVIGAIDDGRLVAENGLWRLHGDPPISQSLASVVARRIGTLTDGQRWVMELLALGEPLRFGELVQLASHEALETAEDRGMVVVTEPTAGGEARLAHPLYGDVVRRELPVLRAQTLRLRLAEMVRTRQPLSREDALRACRWLIDAGAAVPEELLLDAAAAANLAGDAALGAALATQAVEVGGGLRAVIELARADVIRSRFEDAAATLATAEDQAPGHDRASQYFGLRMHVLFWGLGASAEAEAFFRRAEGWSPDPRWARELDPWRLSLVGFDEDFAQRLGEFEAMLAQPGLESEQRRAIEIPYLWALITSGHARQAHALARRLRPTAPVRDHLATYALGMMCNVGLESGEDWNDLEQYMTELSGEAIRVGDHEAAGVAAFTLGALHFERGRYRDAQRWFTEAEADVEHHDTFDTVFCVRALQVGIAHATGDLVGARAALESARGLLSERALQPGQLTYKARAEGWGARTRGDAAGAECFQSEAAATTDATLRSRLLYEAMRSGLPASAVAEQLEQLAARSDARLSAARAAHATAAAARDGDALLAASDAMAAIGADLYAMEAAVDAARQFVADGRQDSARRAERRAWGLYAADQGAEFPRIDGLDGSSAELTRREAQIVALVTRGLSNQEIADQLVLSIRTVETYVYRAMQKRGVDNRREL
jgi:DNA-binding NarL/FixJ family response regulator